MVDERNSLLSVDEIDKVTVLRMNEEFMEFMRREYPEVVTLKTSHGKYGTVVTMDHAEEDKVDGEGVDAHWLSPMRLTWVDRHSPLHLRVRFTNKALPRLLYIYTFTSPSLV